MLGVYIRVLLAFQHQRARRLGTDEEVGRLLAVVLARVRQLLRRRGLEGDDAVTRPDPLAEESLALAGISSAFVQGRIALGRRVGARVWRLRCDPEALWVASAWPRQAHLDGFDLHANLFVPAQDRARLEHLCRYLLRPPVAEDRLRLTGDGRVRLQLRTPWATLYALPPPDGRTLRIRKGSTPEAIHREIYRTLQIPHEVMKPVKIWVAAPSHDSHSTGP